MRIDRQECDRISSQLSDKDELQQGDGVLIMGLHPAHGWVAIRIQGDEINVLADNESEIPPLPEGLLDTLSAFDGAERARVAGSTP